MSTLSELIHYCNEDDPVGAMLLLGEWGCGKTYLIEKDLAGALKDTHIIIKVSLFGMNNQKALQDRSGYRCSSAGMCRRRSSR